jgi:hypothetical protein
LNSARPLSRRWLLVTAAVFLAGVFVHLPITDFCDWLARVYGFSQYDSAVRAGFIALGIGAGASFWLWSSRARFMLGLAVTTLLVLVVVAHKLIVVNAVESIHYPQYALIVVLLVRGGIGLERAWLAGTALGALDEGYQAVALPRGAPDYFDWNDVVLNGIGAAFGVLFVLAFTRLNGRPISRSAGLRWAAVAAAFVIAAILDPPVWSPFFETTPGGRLFHRLTAAEGIVILASVYGFVVWIGMKSGTDSVGTTGTTDGMKRLASE